MPSIRSRTGKGPALLQRAAAFCLAIAALLCCDFGPAFSPDGKAVVFLFADDSDDGDEVCGLALHDLESRTTRVLIQQGTYDILRPAFADDGTLYALASTPATEHEIEHRVLLRIGDGEPEVVARAEAPEQHKSTWNLAIRDGRAWCSWPRAIEGTDGADYGLAWVDTRSGEITFPLSQGRRLYPAFGAAGMYYLEGWEVAEEGAAERTLPRWKLSVGRMGLDDAGMLRLHPIADLDGGAARIAPLVIGRRTLALVASLAEEPDRIADGEEEDGAEPSEPTVVLLDLDGKELRRIRVPIALGRPGSAAFDYEDEHLWLLGSQAPPEQATDPAELRQPTRVLRIDVPTGRATTFDALLWIGTEEADVFGIAASPTEPRIALQVYAGKDAATQVPDLVLLDTSVDPPAATQVTVERER